MKNTLTIEIHPDTTWIEVDYEWWGGMPSGDYNVPDDEPGFEITKVVLHALDGGFDITDCFVDLSGYLNEDKIQEAIHQELREL